MLSDNISVSSHILDILVFLTFVVVFPLCLLAEEYFFSTDPHLYLCSHIVTQGNIGAFFLFAC